MAIMGAGDPREGALRGEDVAGDAGAGGKFGAVHENSGADSIEILRSLVGQRGVS